MKMLILVLSIMSYTKHTNTIGDIQAENIKGNNEKELNRLYVENYQRVENFILTNSGNAEQAKDIYQEAFIAMWRNIQLGKFQPQGDNALNNYLYTIAKNKWLDHLRSSKVKKTISLDSFTENVMTIETSDDSIIERLELIREKFGNLGDNCRELLKRFYYAKESLKAIAITFNWTEETAKNNKYRCMEKLRSLVKK